MLCVFSHRDRFAASARSRSRFKVKLAAAIRSAAVQVTLWLSNHVLNAPMAAVTSMNPSPVGLLEVVVMSSSSSRAGVGHAASTVVVVAQAGLRPM
jgi:hypothetical protein